MQIKSVTIIISGRVQGVGFRYFAKMKAEEFNISGWVKNTMYDKVEIEATGKPENISLYIEGLKIGPSRSIIKSFSVAEFTPIRTITNFTIH